MYQDNEAKGLGTAYLLEALALSFRTASQWEKNLLELTLMELDEDGEFYEEQILYVRHACSIEHVDTHSDWIKERIRAEAKDAVGDGSDIWVRRGELFPSLQFCDAVQKQLQEVLQGRLVLLQIVRRLFELNTFCEEWENSPFDSHKIPGKTTPESTVTLQMYKREHTFLCPDGQERLFNWHARLTPECMAYLLFS